LSTLCLDKFVKMLGTGKIQYNVIDAHLEIAIFTAISASQGKFALELNQSFTHPSPKLFRCDPEAAIYTINFR